MTDGGAQPAGWYPDGYGGMRWWDGRRWTQHYAVPQPPVEPLVPEMDTTKRVLAYLIDFSLQIPGLVVYMVTFFGAFIRASSSRAGDPPWLSWGWMIFGWCLSVGAGAVNRGIVQGVTGRSLGKRVMGLRLVRLSDGRPPGLWWGLLRFVLESAAGIIDVALVFALPKHQRIGDMAAKTMVLTDDQVATMFPGR